MSLLLDTHVLLWWYMDHPNLTDQHSLLLNEAESNTNPVAISAISLWEIAKLVEYGKIHLSINIDKWFTEIDQNQLIEIKELSFDVAIESTRLGPDFHKDPADQLIVATARVYGLHLLTVDRKIVSSGLVMLK